MFLGLGQPIDIPNLPEDKSLADLWTEFLLKESEPISQEKTVSDSRTTVTVKLPPRLREKENQK